MQKLNLIIFFSILLISCKSKITVDEICTVKSIIEGEYITNMQVLYLLQDNDPGDSEIDTMYFKVDKKTKNIFKLKDRMEYESNTQNEIFDLERYIYLRGPNNTGSGWLSTIINHKTPKYTERIKCICSKDINAEIIETIKNQLDKNGYPTNLQESSKFEGEFKEVFIKYQKENNLPHGNLDIRTLESLGIKVIKK